MSSNEATPAGNFERPPNKIAALAAAFVLVMNAPSEKHSQRAAALVDELAAGMTPEEIHQARAAAREHTGG